MAILLLKILQFKSPLAGRRFSRSLRQAGDYCEATRLTREQIVEVSLWEFLTGEGAGYRSERSVLS